LPGDVVQPLHLGDLLRRNVIRLQKTMRFRRPGIGGQAVEVFVGEQALG